MKLSELGLAQKPQTKYFTHGYVSFSTVEDKLFYSISFYKNRGISIITTETKPVKDLEHFNQLMKLDAREVQA